MLESPYVSQVRHARRFYEVSSWHNIVSRDFLRFVFKLDSFGVRGFDSLDRLIEFKACKMSSFCSLMELKEFFFCLNTQSLL